MSIIRAVCPCLVLIFVVIAAGGISPWTGTCVQVIDGDTVAISREGQAVTVRLADVDAPELDQPYGTEALDFLTKLLENREVEVVSPTRDASGLTVARVVVDGRDASHELLAAGLAWTGDTSDEKLILASISSRGEGLGLWQDANPEPPWDFRNDRAGPTPTPVPVIRRLREVAQIVELKKNEEGRTIISGRPAGNEVKEGMVAADGGLQLRFSCKEEEFLGCVEQEFIKGYRAAYKGDGVGSYSVKRLDLGGGSVTVAFSGNSALGHHYDIGASCDCGGGDCECLMQLMARDPRAASRQ